MFFGGPHRGLDTSDLEVMTASMNGEWKMVKVDLVGMLKEGSERLDERRGNFAKVLQAKGPNLSVISFWEQSQTPKFTMVAIELRERSGAYYLLTLCRSARYQLQAPN